MKKVCGWIILDRPPKSRWKMMDMKIVFKKATGLSLDCKFVRLMDLPFNPRGSGAAVQANQRLRHSEWASLGDLVMGQKRGTSQATSFGAKSSVPGS